MGLFLACKAFFKALGNKEEAVNFVSASKEKLQIEAAPKVDHSHLRLLSLLQGSGRLIDFLKEDLSSFNDTQVGAAARLVHQDCGKLLEELVTIRPVYEEQEGASISVPAGYDTSSIKVIGKVTGQPPFQGKLVHKGWKVHKRSLPKQVGDGDMDVLWAAEVEVK